MTDIVEGGVCGRSCEAFGAPDIVADGPIPATPLNWRFLKGASIEREHEQYRRDAADLAGWLAEGKRRPHIGGRYALARAGDAPADLMEGRATGKLVIEMR